MDQIEEQKRIHDAETGTLKSKLVEQAARISELEALSDELKMFRSIDWIKLGKWLEHDLGYDCTGWEFLGKAWRDNDEPLTVWYIQQRFNKEYHYNQLFDSEVVNEHEEIISQMMGFRRLLKHREEEAADLKAENQALKSELEKHSAEMVARFEGKPLFFDENDGVWQLGGDKKDDKFWLCCIKDSLEQGQTYEVLILQKETE